MREKQCVKEVSSEEPRVQKEDLAWRSGDLTHNNLRCNRKGFKLQVRTPP